MDTNVAQILEALARSQPAAPAIHAPGRTTLTFFDLGEQIRYVRERFRGWEIASGDVVAGAVPTRPEMAVACATIPASATFVPLSPTLTADAYSELLVRLQPKAVVVPADDRHPMHVAAERCGVAEITLAGELSRPAGMFHLDLTRHDQSLRLPATVGRDIAYVMCTSGTTGRAKLVPIAHRRSALFSKAFGDWSGLAAHDIGCHLSPFHHGHGLHSALMVPLLRGSSIVCLPESDIEAFYHALDTYRPTWLTAVFTIHKAILERATDHRDIVARSRFRFFKVGSGALDSREIDQLEQLFRAPVLSALIAQEVFLVTHDPLPPRVRKHGSVGLPVCNDVALLGDGGAWCRPGDIGEIVVRGPTVFEGYLDDPQATDAAFVDGWCRTGDLGRFDDDGYLFMEGRVKDLIHRGGEKFAPMRIDLAIEALAGVRAAAAFGVPHPTLGEEVAAAVIRDADAAIDEAQIIEHVRQRLGPKGAPRAVYFVDALPRTDSGKVRRSELSRSLGLDRPAASARADSVLDTPAESLSPLEAGLASVWSTVLQLKSVGANDDFFLLGGDSLRGVRLLAGVKALCDVELTLELLLGDAATIAGMARAIEAVRSGSAGREHRIGDPVSGGIPTRIPRRQERGAVILSDTQRRMWFLAQLDPHSAAYNESRAYRLTGDVDLGALERSVRYLVRRHEILRTTYALIDDEPRQVVQDESFIDVQPIDLSATPANEQDRALHRLLLAWGTKAFDHQSGPLLRCVLVRLGEQEHVFLRVWHHIVSDGRSSAVFDRELAVAYGAFVKGLEPRLPPLPVQYADYALWQRERLQGEVLERQLAYWRSRLAGVTTLELPTDRARPSVPNHEGAHLAFELSARLVRALKELGRREGATLFMTLLAVYQVLLYRYSGQEDIAVGTPIAGRGHPDLEGLIGFFANTLVLRSDLSGHPSFRELLARVRETSLGAYAHQDMPFEKLVEELAPSRDLSGNPLFDVMINHVDNLQPLLDLPGLAAQQIRLPSVLAKFAMTLYVRAHERGVELRLVYQSALFSPARIACMLDQYVHLLEQVTVAPETSISDYSLITARARAWLPDPTIPIEATSPPPVVAQVLAWALSAPERIAVSGSGTQWTYAELTGRAASLASALQRMGVGRSDVVAIVGPRSVGLVGAMLAVLMSGGVFLTIDPTLPDRRRRVMLTEARAKVVCLIGQPGDNERDLETDDTLVVLRTDLEPASHVGPEERPEQVWSPPTIHGDDPAYVFFTSGSTGQPKAVLGSHKGFSHFLQWQRGAFAIGADDRVSQLIGLTFDPLLRDVFLPLTSGATLCVPTDSDLLDTIGWMQREGVTVVHTTPTVMQSWLLDRQQRLELASLRWVFVAGEPLTDVLIGKWRRAISGPAQLVNLYGPTETTMARCFHTIPAEVTPGVQPIGVPLPDSQALVLNAKGLLCGIGEVGEIVLRTPFRSLGYLNLPDETARCFRPNPFRDDASDLVYFTGDLGRYRPDGLLEIAGRVDDQVKIRGVRIDPGEVTATLARHEAVRHCVVVARDDVHGQPQLVGYVVAESGKRVDARDLRVHMTGQLPQAFVPGTFVFLDALPVLPNGKIDRLALPSPHVDREEDGGKGESPHDALEEVVAEVWREVLRVEQVGVHDNFFELGGHSLLATQVVTRLSRLLQVELPLRRMFEAPTIAELASALGKILREVEPLNDDETALQQGVDGHREVGDLFDGS